MYNAVLNYENLTYVIHFETFQYLQDIKNQINVLNDCHLNFLE